MGHVVTNLDVNDSAHTANATPIGLALFEFPNGSCALVKVNVLAVRSDGAAKAWSLESLVKKIAGVMTVSETIPSPPNAFGSAGDDTALTGVTISLFNDGTYLGANCTGQAGQDIGWTANISGIMSTTTP